MSDIPAARAELRTMRHEAEAARIYAVIANLMYRDDPARPRLPLAKSSPASVRRADA